MIRILLIEDDLDDVLLLKDSLFEISNVKINLAYTINLSEGLIYLANHEIDVILLDLNLPDSQGLETLKIILNKFPKIPVVVMSGLADDFTTLEAVKQGAQDYLIKGEIGGPILVRIIRYAIERKQAEEILRASEAKYRTLVNTSPDGIAMADLTGKILLCNQKAAKLHGYENPEALFGMDTFDLIVPEERQQSKQIISKKLKEGSLTNIEYTLLRKDGSRFPAELSAAIILDTKGAPTSFIGISRDITERKQAEREIAQRLQNIQALQRIDLAIASYQDLKRILNVVLEQTKNELNIDAADILLFDPQLKIYKYAAGIGFRGKEIEETRLYLGEEFAGCGVMKGKAKGFTGILVNNSAQLFRAHLLAGESFETYFGSPLIAKGQVNGILEVFHRSPLSPDENWLNFLTLLAEQTALAVDNANLYTELKSSNDQLFAAYDHTIEGWSHALDLRDKETEGHTQRVTEVTVKLARTAGISEEELVHVRRGALLHDIGKMGVPDQILLKADTLTDEEWVAMRKHPGFAFELLSPIEYLKPALDIPYCHHEKWDGSGYPRGLIGEQIPLIARVFSIVDVWDALLSDRPYRKGWPKEKVIKHIKSLTGKDFDPKVVELFLRLIGEDAKEADLNIMQ